MRNRKIAGLLLALAIPGTLAQAAAAQNGAPPAREIIGRYVEAIGGADAVRRAGSWKATGTFAMAAAGITGAIEAYQAGGLSFARVTLPGIDGDRGS